MIAIKWIDELKQDDGSLDGVSDMGMDYIWYKAGDSEIVLDGSFTIPELEYIVNIMKADR